MSSAAASLILPPSLVGRSDVSRLVRELENLDATITAQQIRGQKLEFRMTPTLEDTIQANSTDLADVKQRDALKHALRQLKAKSPIIHVTFAEEPQPDFMRDITAWVRQQLHGAALIRIGLQPGIIAGCIVRTPSHIYDFSIQHILKDKKPLLMKELQGSKA